MAGVLGSLPALASLTFMSMLAGGRAYGHQPMLDALFHHPDVERISCYEADHHTERHHAPEDHLQRVHRPHVASHHKKAHGRSHASHHASASRVTPHWRSRLADLYSL